MKTPLLIDIVGYLAAAFGTSLMLPQVIKTIKTKKVDDLSMIMVIVYIINCFLWGFYGFLIHSRPVLFCNLIALMIGFFQFYLKIKYSFQAKNVLK